MKRLVAAGLLLAALAFYLGYAAWFARAPYMEVQQLPEPIRNQRGTFMPFDGAEFEAALARKQARREKSMRETRMYRGYRALRVIDGVTQLLRNGRSWTRGVACDGQGRYCLVGALREIRRGYRSGDKASAYLLRAQNELYGTTTAIPRFNDECKTFTPIRKVLARARELAAKYEAGL